MRNQRHSFNEHTKEWFNALSNALTAGNQPQNYHQNPCFVEEDLEIEQEGCDIKEDDEYIERVVQ